MKNFILFIVLFGLLSCEKETDNVYSFQIKNEWDYVAWNVVITSSEKDSIFLEKILIDSITNPYETKAKVLYIQYNITEGLLKDTFFLTNNKSIFVIRNKH